MRTANWSLAELDDAELDLVREAEETLGADVVLVYRPGGDGVPASDPPGLRPSELDESKLECLQGLERRIGSVAVAYRRAG